MTGNNGGHFLMSVEIAQAEGRHAVSFSNKMSDSAELLAAETDSAALLPDGSLEFAFTDGWGNQGSARIYRTGLIDLTVTEAAPGKQGARNYGSFFVYKGACLAEEFSGEFSGGGG